jgi:endonuclease III
MPIPTPRVTPMPRLPRRPPLLISPAVIPTSARYPKTRKSTDRATGQERPAVASFRRSGRSRLGRQSPAADLFIDPAPFSLQPTNTLMATQSKTQLLTNMHALLKKRYKARSDPHPTRLSVLEAVVYGICHEDTTREHANQALSRFEGEFFDWNELRVSSVDEIQETLAGIPGPEERAQRIRRFLRQLFNRTYGFTLDTLTKKPLKEALKVLQTYDAFASDYVTATVIQQALGGHAIPIDKAAHRVLERVGISESEVPALRAILERAVPKNRGSEFLDLIEDLATDTCLETDPECPRCELRKMCAFALTHKGDAHSAAHAARPHPAKAAKEPTKTSTGKDTALSAPAPPKKNPRAQPPKEAAPPAKPPRDKHRGPK